MIGSRAPTLTNNGEGFAGSLWAAANAVSARNTNTAEMPLMLVTENASYTTGVIVQTC